MSDRIRTMPIPLANGSNWTWNGRNAITDASAATARAAIKERTVCGPRLGLNQSSPTAAAMRVRTKKLGKSQELMTYRDPSTHPVIAATARSPGLSRERRDQFTNHARQRERLPAG